MSILDHNRKNKWVILIAAILVIIVVLVVVYFKFFQVTTTYYMVAEDVGGLIENDVVFIQDTEVGEVKGIENFPEAEGSYLLELAVDDNINFPDRSYAEILKSDATGIWFVEISLLASGGYFKGGDTIPLHRIQTKSSNIIGDLIDSIPDSATDLEGEEKDNQIEQGITSFKIQFMVSKDTISKTSPKFKGLEGVTFYYENGFYKYIVGNEGSMEDASKLQSEVKKKGFKDAFIIAFRDGKRIPLDEAR